MTAHNKVWLVTGASGGLGLATVKELLAAGYPVEATTRDGGLPRRPAHRFSRRLGALPAGADRRLPQRART